MSRGDQAGDGRCGGADGPERNRWEARFPGGAGERGHAVLGPAAGAVVGPDGGGAELPDSVAVVAVVAVVPGALALVLGAVVEGAEVVEGLDAVVRGVLVVAEAELCRPLLGV